MAYVSHPVTIKSAPDGDVYLERVGFFDKLERKQAEETQE